MRIFSLGRFSNTVARARQRVEHPGLLVVLGNPLAELVQYAKVALGSRVRTPRTPALLVKVERRAGARGSPSAAKASAWP